MAFRIADCVIRGEIDNTRRGAVTGTLWLVGDEPPIVLRLSGDCWRDLAGCRCRFTNPNPLPDTVPDGLVREQTGVVGDITASRKVRVPADPQTPRRRRSRAASAQSEHMANALYLEWYSERNGRVVIESTDFALEVSLPEWQMTAEEEHQQVERNQQALLDYLEHLEAAIRPPTPVEVPDDREMDEFEWERFLKQSDARTERFGELLDKFEGHSDADRIVARHMGWDGPPGTTPETPAAGEDAPEDLDILDDIVDLPEPEPDPTREGIDWVRNGHDGIDHPLQHRCNELGLRMYFDAKEHGLHGAANPDLDLDEMTFKTHCAAAKMAGVLTDVAQGRPGPAGFVVAGLKRALARLHEAMAATQRVQERGLLPDQTPYYHTELHAIRAGIIDLMDQQRRRFD